MSGIVINLAAARAASQPAAALPLESVVEVTALPIPQKSEEELDAESQITRAAVTYTSLNGAFNGDGSPSTPAIPLSQRLSTRGCGSGGTRNCAS